MNKRGIILTPADFNGVDWFTELRENNFNTLGIHSGEGANHDLLKRLGKYAGAAFRAEVAKAGLACEYETHAAASFMPPELFAKHPEYFVFDAALNARTDQKNWCITNPDVPAILEENAARLAKLLPSSTHNYYFWCADMPGANCQCPKCRKLSVSDLQLRSVNAIAAGLKRTDPLAKAAFLSYHDVCEPPRCTEPAENVFLEYAPYQRSYAESIADENSSVNARFRKSFSEMVNFFGAKNCCILEYYLDSSWFSRYRKPAVKPVFSDEVLRRDLDYYLSAGIRAITTFAVYMDGEYFQNNGDEEVRRYGRILNEYLPD